MQRASHGEKFTAFPLRRANELLACVVVDIRGVGNETTAGNNNKSDDSRIDSCVDGGREPDPGNSGILAIGLLYVL